MAKLFEPYLPVGGMKNAPEVVPVFACHDRGWLDPPPLLRVYITPDQCLRSLLRSRIPPVNIRTKSPCFGRMRPIPTPIFRGERTPEWGNFVNDGMSNPGIGLEFC